MHLVNSITGGLKILGGFTDVYSTNSRTHYGKAYKWGSHQNGQSGTKVLTVTNSYCWSASRKTRGYCYQRLVVSTKNKANENYYEILGTNQVVMDARSRFIDRTEHKYEQ